jgi:Zn-dependent peptidase ImmA (M78 family)
VQRSEYYESLKELARETRSRYGLTTPRVLRSDLRRIYRTEGIGIFKCPVKLKRLRGAYIDDESGPAVLINGNLPAEPTVFTLAHELKHHLVDRGTGLSFCGESNATAHVEIGAEIFAAELIFPETDFWTALKASGVTPDTYGPEALVRLKARVRSTMSYASMAKRIEFRGYAPQGSHAKVAWRAIEDALLGVPFFRR